MSSVDVSPSQRFEYLDVERLRTVVGDSRTRFAHAAPFAHLVIDGFLQSKAAHRVAEDFAIPDDVAVYYHHVNNRTRGLTDVDSMPRSLQQLFDELASPPVLELLGSLVGCPALLFDDGLDGGGLHDAGCGGYLNLHADFLVHTTRPTWRRRLNLLVYLNETWDPAWGGALELWDLEDDEPTTVVEPAFNRCVVFETSERSFHGYPRPLTCPESTTRNSIAAYYYEDTARPGRITSTDYRAAPGDSTLRRVAIAADRIAVRTFSRLKRRGLVSDQLVSRIARRRPGRVSSRGDDRSTAAQPRAAPRRG